MTICSNIIIAQGDSELRSLAHLIEMPSAEAFRTAQSKSAFSMFLEQHNIPHPNTVRFNSADPSMPSRLDALRLPVIIKPTWGGGGHGIHVIDTREELLPYLMKSSTLQNPLIIQEFIQGYDVGSAVFSPERRNTVYDDAAKHVRKPRNLPTVESAAILR